MLEINGITYTSDGETLAGDFEGNDVINLGSTDVSGNSVITAAIGARYRVSGNMLLGLTYEWPLTSREDLLDSRITVDFLYLF